MFIDFIIQKIKDNPNADAVIYNNKIYNYKYVLDKYLFWTNFLKKNINKGIVVAVQADYNPDSIALILALIENENIFVPISSSDKDLKNKIAISEAEFVFSFTGNDFSLYKTEINATHRLINTLKEIKHPGIIIFSSGSTGEPKAAIHDFTKLLEKFKIKKFPLRTINFLLFDHWGGLNTLLYILSNAGVVGLMPDRTPEKICKFIEKYKIELLPTTPTFINLIIMSRAYEKYDLSSLKIVSYGTEPMPETTLKIFNKLYPEIKLLQTYGLTELGVMRTQSKSSESLWIKIGGDGYKTKILDNTLYIKAKSTILGYLNAETPIDSEGWYNTGDKVEQDGEWIKFLGRASDVINVGGQKVFPSEVESVLLQLPNIIDCTVFGEKNPITGQVVAVKVRLSSEQKIYEIKKEIKLFCKSKLENYKIPVRVILMGEAEYTARFKKIRK